MNFTDEEFLDFAVEFIGRISHALTPVSVATEE